MKFKSGLGFILFVVVLLLVMLSACRWQLLRAQEKEHIQQAFMSAQNTEFLTLEVPLPESGNAAYRKVQLSGHYLSDQQFILDNRFANVNGVNQVGYEVLTPLHIIPEGPVVLINRGWVALGTDRQVLPDITVDQSQRLVKGIVNLMQGGFRIGAMDSDEQWPRVIQFVDFQELADRLQAQVYPAVVMLAENEPDGYVREWQPIVDGSMKHYSYALQWLLMAIAVLILFFVFARIKNPNEK